MEKKNQELIIIFAISILITVLLAICCIHYFNKKTGPTPAPVNNKTKYTFKVLTYEVPDSLKFSDYNEDQFKIEGTGWHALVKLYYDEKMSINNNSELFSKIISNKEKDIESSETFIMNNREIISFNKSSDKSVLCYFISGWLFDYEVRIYNEDGTYNNEALNEIVPVLISFKSDYNISDYEFDVIDLKSSNNTSN